MSVAEITDLSEAMAVAVKVDFRARTGGDRRAALRELGRLESRFTALKAAVVGAFEWADWGVTASHNGQPFCRGDHRHKPRSGPD